MDWAMEQACALNRPDNTSPHTDTERIATALRAAERRGRIGGLETAEMIARSHVHHFNGLQIAASIQSEIDSLAPKEKVGK